MNRIESWLEQGRKKRAIYTIIVYDSFDQKNHPIHIYHNQKLNEIIVNIEKSKKHKIIKYFSHN